nr:unnamed protein product [Digitaria exilis]
MAEGHGAAAAEAGVRVEAESSSQSQPGVASSRGAMSQEDCISGIRSALNHPTARFLREQMEKSGCQVWPRLIRAATCNSAGGYASQEGIRANHLSGDCHYKRELLRGFMKIRGHEQDCVKRRALMSVKDNPYCSEAAAKDAVEAVWHICYNDTRPFDRAP